MPPDKKWRSFGIKLPWLGGIFDLVVASGEETVIRPDGEGTQMGCVLTRLPEDFTNVLKEQHDKELGGVVSLSIVTMLASALELAGLGSAGAKKAADNMRSHYKDAVDQLGLKTMATTWGQGLGKLGIRSMSGKEQAEKFKKLGVDIIYTKNPEKFAHLLGSGKKP